MRTAWLSALVAALSLGALVLACSSTDTTPTDAGGPTSEPGCCPDVQTGCTLRRYGKKTSPGDTCIVGFDGVVPDPNAPGWTQTTIDGCPAWTPPKGVPLKVCGALPPNDAEPFIPDASDDASDGAPSDAGSDAPNDAADAGD